MDEQELIRQVQGGDEMAFSEIVRIYKNKIVNFLFQLTSDYQRAVELSQETFMRVYFKANKYRPVAPFSSWVYTIASNLAKTELKKMKKYQAISLEEIQNTLHNEDSSNNPIDVLINDFDSDGDDIDITNVTQPSNGTITFTVDYVFYTPNPDYSGSDQFSYTISDGNKESTSTVNVVVTDTDNPVAFIDTSMGIIAVELYEDKVPNTVQNFINLANDIRYVGNNLDGCF